jgi:hypothetical protein
MNIDLRKPQFAGTDKEKLQQMHSFMSQLVDQLQFAFSNIGESSGDNGGGGARVVQQTVVQTTSSPSTPADAEATFAAIKNLIIKSSDIVEAYSDKITENLSEAYVAQSEYGNYVEKTDATITKEAGRLTLEHKRVEGIIDTFSPTKQYNEEGKETNANFAMVRSNEGYIKTGFLGGGLYGVEIGQVREGDAIEEFKGTLRITPERISFLDINGIEIAWLEQHTFHANTLEAVKRQKVGGFVDEVDEDTHDVTTRWMPKGG